MKRTFVLLLFIVGAAGILWILKSKNSHSDASVLTGREFSLKENQRVGRIEIKEASGRKVSLNKKNDSWYIYDRYPVRENAMDNLLEVMNGLTIQYIPARAAIKNIERDLNLIGIDVKAFDERGELILNYIIGSVTPDERGTYAIVKNATQPYVVHLPNLEGSIRGRFIMKDVDWRDRKILHEDISSIQAIRMEYPKNQKESFTIEKLEGRLTLKPLHQQAYLDPEKSNSTLIKEYMENFRILEAEYIENENPYKDSINVLVPFAILTISYEKHADKQLKLFPVDDLMNAEHNTQKVQEASKIRRYFIDCSWGDFMLVQQRLVGKFLRGYSYFFNRQTN